MARKNIDVSLMPPDHTPRRLLLAVRFLKGNDGITSHLITLSRKLMEQGWEVALASGMDEASGTFTRGPSMFEAMGVKHFYVPFPDFGFSKENLVGAVQSFPRLMEVVESYRPNVIHIHSLSLCPYMFAVRTLRGVPFVSSCHIEPEPKGTKVLFGSLLNKVLPRFLGNRMVAVGSELQQAFHSIMGVKKEDIRVIYYGMETDHFRPASPEERAAARAEYDLSPDEKVICLIGRLNPVKGHKVLIQALAILKAEGFNATALIAGTGDWEADIRSAAEQAGVTDRMRMLGFADARNVLWASDAIVLPSYKEASPLVIPEAMFCGVVPIRTPAAGAYDQINDGVDGFIVPFNDPAALAQRIRFVLENDERRACMSAAALKSVHQKFTAERMTADMIALYEEVIRLQHLRLASAEASSLSA